MTISSSIAIASSLALAVGIRGQTPNEPSAGRFEVASVRHVQVGATTAVFDWKPPRDHGRYTLRHVPLKTVLQIANRLPPHQIIAPSWLAIERYDITATMPEDTPEQQVLQMLKNLLVERFHLEQHWEEREMPVYAMVVGKKGEKLRKTEDPNAMPRVSRGPRTLDVRNRTMADFAAMLSLWVDRPVVDLTGLVGAYDFKLNWSSDQTSDVGGNGGLVPASSAGATDPAAILGSLERIGLKATARKLSIRFLVVDRADREPTEN